MADNSGLDVAVDTDALVAITPSPRDELRHTWLFVTNWNRFAQFARTHSLPSTWCNDAIRGFQCCQETDNKELWVLGCSHHLREFAGVNQSTLHCWLYDLSYPGMSSISQDGNKLSVILSLFVFEITNQTEAYT